MSNTPRNWLVRCDRVLIGLLWGANGLRRGYSLSQLQLSDFLGLLAFGVTLLVQTQIDRKPTWIHSAYGAVNFVLVVACLWHGRENVRRALSRAAMVLLANALLFWAISAVCHTAA